MQPFSSLIRSRVIVFEAFFGAGHQGLLQEPSQVAELPALNFQRLAGLPGIPSEIRATSSTAFRLARCYTATSRRVAKGQRLITLKA